VCATHLHVLRDSEPAVTLLGLAGLIAASLIGPLLAAPRRFQIPTVVGEIAIGVVLGTTGFRWVHPTDPVLTYLAQAGFALVMLVAGSHVPIANLELRKALGRGFALSLGIGVLSIPVAAGLTAVAHTHHTALYAVLLASSSAAVVMPIVIDESLAGDRVLTLMAQVAIADTACIIALPLAAEPSRAGRAAVGSVIVLAAAGLAFIVLRELVERGLVGKLHAESVRRTFGLEMRISLAALFALAGVAIDVHVSVMLAGFAFGLVLAAIGPPRRLASQLFAVTEGFLGPVFLIWLGASLDLRALAHHPRLLVVAVGLAAATTALHALARLLGQPLPLALLASAQLGVPVAAVALGAHNSLLAPGEGGAILGAAVLTLGVAAVAGAIAQRTEVTPAAAVLPPPREPEPAAPVAKATPKPVAKPAVKAAAGPATDPVTDPVTEPVTEPAARPNAEPKPARPQVRPGSPPPIRPPTPNPATKPIVQSNVRIQPAPTKRRPEVPPDAD
jgi:Kef-type K+ transport system membrane component KefB